MLLSSRIAVIVPAFNEQPFIGSMLAGIPTWIDLIVVVDDASEDGTVEAVRQIRDPRLSLVRHPHNRGVGASIASGYLSARERGADILVVMAGDGQMDPSDLAALLAPVASKEVMYAKGNRFAHPALLRSMPLPRVIGGYVLSRLTGWALRLPHLEDSQCGYTALAASALDHINVRTMWQRYGYPNDLLGMLKMANLPIVEIPVRPLYGAEKSGLKARHFGVMLALIARAAWRVRRKRG